MQHFVISLAIAIFWPATALASSFNRSEIPSDSLYTADEIRNSKYQTEMSFLLFSETGWTADLVLGHVKGLAKVYLQCGVRIARISLFESAQLKLPAGLSKYDKGGPNSLLNLAEQTLEIPRPLVFLIGNFTDSEATPF